MREKRRELAHLAGCFFLSVIIHIPVFSFLGHALTVTDWSMLAMLAS